MKKVLLTLVAVFALSMSVKAQGNFEVGAAIGFPSRDAADLSDFMIAIDGYYMFKQEDALINLGPTVGYRHFFTNDIFIGGTDGVKINDGSFITVGGAGRITIFGPLRAGADAGYAIGLTDIVDGGFYFRPIVGIDILDTLELNASYEYIWDTGGIFGTFWEDGNTWGSFQIGAKLEF